MNTARALAWALLAMVVGTTPCGAVSSSVAPPYIEKLARAGQVVMDTIAYTNHGDEMVSVSVSIVDFDVGERNEVIEFPAGTQLTTLAPYLRVAPTEIRVAPRHQVFFRYAARVPEEFGHLRAMIYFLTRPEIPESGSPQVIVASRMGVPLYVENAAATPAHLQFGPVAWARSGESGEALTLDLAVTNDGGRIIRPRGYVEVRSADGRFERTFPFNDGRAPVLPKKAGRLTMRVGPVPGGELLLRLRLEDSSRTMWRSEHRLPAASG